MSAKLGNDTDKILESLNTEQEKAVKHDNGPASSAGKPLLIIAGAGTGKTSVITRRIAYLIAQKKAKPSEILALTFTDKAATEMEERIDMLVPYGFNDVWVSTFHAFGDRILRESALESGFAPDYHLLSSSEAAVFLKENLFAIPMKHYRPASDPAKFVDAILTLISRAKDEDISPEQYIKFAEDSLKKAKEADEVEEAQKQLEVANIYKSYEDLKRKNGFLDFGDQVTLTLNILRQHPSILKKYQDRFKYILVDEFQDTNYCQFELVKLLAQKHKSITVVGDDDQSIYKFRGACLSNILNFNKEYPDAKEVVLRKNYRSNQKILDSAYKLITHNNPDRLEVKNNINKALESDRKEGIGVEHLHFDTLSTESDEVAKKIKNFVDKKKYNFSDFAILVRANDHAVPFLKSLNMLDIPWHFSGTEGLYKREEIRSILSFLRIIANPFDSISLHYFASGPYYNFNQLELAQINHAASYRRRSLMEVLKDINKYEELSGVSEETKDTAKKMITDLEEFYKLSTSCSTGEIVYRFLKRMRILERLYNSVNYEEVQAAQNIAKFFKIIESFSDVAEYDRVKNFVEHIDALLSVGDDPSSAEPDINMNAVRVQTIHKAKGLEFPVVFMVSLVEDRFPSRNRKDQIELPEGLIKEFLPSGDYHIQEERRLFYVGMTRAKDALFLTSAKDYGGKRSKKISRFLLEAVDKPKADEEAFKATVKEQLERFAPKPVNSELMLVVPKSDGLIKLSPYAIDDYRTCPLKYKYVHVLRVPILRHHTLVFGELIHKVLREYYRARKEKLKFDAESMTKLYETLWSSAGFLSREHEDVRFVEGKEMLLKYYEQQEKAGIIPVSVEDEFKFTLDNSVRVVGRWDRLDNRSGSNVIVDFKTTARVKDQKAADKEIKESRQLLIYALGFEAKHGKLPDSLELHFLGPGLVSSLAPEKEELDELKEDILKTADGIRACNFEAKPAYMACANCAYSNICPSQTRD